MNKPLQRQPIFIDSYGNQEVEVPDNCLCVDGFVAGAAASYSHWKGVESPEELRHDLSTGIVLRAAENPQKYLQPFTTVANNHVDTDGLLSLAVACDPSLIEYKDLLLSAAAYGDFSHYVSEAGARLALCLQQYLARSCAQDHNKAADALDSGSWEQDCFDTVIPQMRAIIAESSQADAERDQQIERIHACQSAIADGCIAIENNATLSVIETAHVHGHFPDGPMTIGQDDDLPPWALSEVIPSKNFQLLCFTHGGSNDKDTSKGIAFQLDAPRHSWAQTWDLPTIKIPDFSSVQRALQQLETADVKWIVRPQSTQIGFVCELASVDSKRRRLAPSMIERATVVSLIRSILGN